jgi:ferric-dicitrate binding protein FerR (iron transport regulator)
MANPNDNKDTLLARWLSGELNKKELDDLQKQEGFEDLKRIVQTVDQLRPPAYDKQKALASIKARRQPKANVRRLPRWSYPIAASVLLLVGLFVSNPFGGGPVKYDTLAGKQQEITLPDGSEVTLNHGSHLSFHTKGWNKERTLHLDGEAFFEVKKGSDFQVVTDKGTVSVLGTSFNVYARDHGFEVHCHTGKVGVVNEHQQEAILAPGQVTKEENGQLKVTDFVVENGPAWQQGVSKFSAAPIIRVISELEGQFGVDITHQGLNAQEAFTGSFIHEDLNTALKMVCDPMGISYTLKGDKVTLSKDK